MKATRRCWSNANSPSPLLVAAAALVLGGCAASEPDVVRVTADEGLASAEVATGFAAGGDRVVTVAHAIGGARHVEVDGRPARIVRTDARLDLAVLRVRGMDADPPSFGGGGPGTRVRITGRAATLVRRATATLRTPTATYRRPVLELRATVGAGDSGAPVLDGDGRVVGVLFARSQRSAWAVDASALEHVLARSP